MRRGEWCLVKTTKGSRLATCTCGRVQCRAIGPPIVSLVCYCSDCQEAGARIEALRHAANLRDADGGTPLLTFRDDRFSCLIGAENLESHRIKATSKTRRMVASCCNSAMFLKYEPGFWVSCYQARFDADLLPPLDMRIYTRHRRSETPLPRDVPSFSRSPMQLFLRGAFARLTMLLGV